METTICQGLDSIMAVAEMQARVLYDHAIANGYTFKGATRPPRLSDMQRQRIKQALGNLIPAKDYLKFNHARLEI